MTREERHIAVLNSMLENMDVYDSIQPTTERKKAIKAAIKALSQEPCDECRYKRTSICGNCDEFDEFEEIDYVQEHKKIPVTLDLTPCDDAISREAVLDGLRGCICDEWVKTLFATMVKQLPSVNPQKSGKWDRLYNWLNDMRLGIAPDETVYDDSERMVRESQVDIIDEIMEWIEKHTNCGARMESEDKE